MLGTETTKQISNHSHHLLMQMKMNFAVYTDSLECINFVRHE
jgi:hypothetical protein